MLDLSGRNRMLYFRPTLRTVELIGSPHPLLAALSESGTFDLDDHLLAAPSLSALERQSVVEEARRAVRRIAATARTFADEQGGA